MKSKTEAINTFSEGLNMDLNPINTPNNTLTDCLNGTILTYNGNELMLQNDMGNYKLKNVSLSTNFTPVGIKEYNGIIYIASYNPVSKEFELGSYPSPQTIFSSESGQVSKKAHEIIFPDNPSNVYNYTEVSESGKLFAFISNPAEDTYLNPGDKFKLEYDTEIDVGFEYVELDFSVLDKDNKLHYIGDIDAVNANPPDDNFFRVISWYTPGWLCAKWNVSNFSTFKVGVSKLKYDPYSDVTDVYLDLNCNLQAVAGKYLDVSCYSDPNTTFGLYVKHNNGVEKLIDNVEWDVHSITKSLSAYTCSAPYSILGMDKTIDNSIAITPVITNNGISVKYDNLTVVVSLNDLDKLALPDGSVANTYTYIVYDDKVNITFDTLISASELTGLGVEINVYNLYDSITPIKTAVFGSIDHDQIMDVTFEYDDTFTKENLYMVKFQLTFDSGVSEKKYLTPYVYKSLVTSVAMNSITGYSDYSTITGQEWINYLRSSTSGSMEFSKAEVVSSEIINDTIPTHWPVKYQWAETENIPEPYTIYYKPICNTKTQLSFNSNVSLPSVGFWINPTVTGFRSVSYEDGDVAPLNDLNQVDVQFEWNRIYDINRNILQNKYRFKYDEMIKDVGYHYIVSVYEDQYKAISIKVTININGVLKEIYSKRYESGYGDISDYLMTAMNYIAGELEKLEYNLLFGCMKFSSDAYDYIYWSLGGSTFTISKGSTWYLPIGYWQPFSAESGQIFGIKSDLDSQKWELPYTLDSQVYEVYENLVDDFKFTTYGGETTVTQLVINENYVSNPNIRIINGISVDYDITVLNYNNQYNILSTVGMHNISDLVKENFDDKTFNNFSLDVDIVDFAIKASTDTLYVQLSPPSTINEKLIEFNSILAIEEGKSNDAAVVDPSSIYQPGEATPNKITSEKHSEYVETIEYDPDGRIKIQMTSRNDAAYVLLQQREGGVQDNKFYSRFEATPLPLKE